MMESGTYTRHVDQKTAADALTEKFFSGMVLAGGFSSRMRKSKAELMLDGETLLARQINKLRALEITDLMLSGCDQPITGTRFVPDVYPHRGPLSGLHACLQKAACPACLVLSVDVPLVPVSTLQTLLKAHTDGATVLVHQGKTEPLIAVYDKEIWKEAEQVLKSDRTAMMKLLSRVPVREVEYQGDIDLLSNCNTPEEFERICLMESRMKDLGPGETKSL